MKNTVLSVLLLLPCLLWCALCSMDATRERIAEQWNEFEIQFSSRLDYFSLSSSLYLVAPLNCYIYLISLSN